MSDKTEYKLNGYEEIERKVSTIGNGAHVLVPRKWKDADVKIIRVGELATNSSKT